MLAILTNLYLYPFRIPEKSGSFLLCHSLPILMLRIQSCCNGNHFVIKLQGADSSHESVDALEAAKALALSSSAIVAVSGAVDFITNGGLVVSVNNGVPMMQKITATGCAVTALIAAFVSVEPSDALAAAACALAIFGLAGEIGMESAKGPASLRTHLIDALYCLDEETVTSRVKISLQQ